MLEAVKVALDPTPVQERLILSHAGAARVAYNAGLAHVKETIETGGKLEWTLYALRRWWNANKGTLAVDADGTPWWRENSKEAYNSGMEALSDALSNWSKSRKGERKGRRVGFPRFKAKDRETPRFAYTTGSFGLVRADPKALRLPRIGRVHCMENVAGRVDGARALRMTVSCRAGRWHAALTVERADPTARRTPREGAVGIDLGVKSLATLSDGTTIANPHTLKANERRLKRAQRSLSRDMLDKLTTWLADTYSDISIEDLNVAGMVKNHRLAQSIQDAAFAEFRRQLTYKTARTGAGLHIIGRWYPSSKTCSNCGTVKTKLSLSERVYHCEECGLSIDRDLNAAVNIQVAGSAPETLNAHGGDGRRNDASRRATQTPVKCEPSSHASGVRLGADDRKTVLQTKTN